MALRTRRNFGCSFAPQSAGRLLGHALGAEPAVEVFTRPQALAQVGQFRPNGGDDLLVRIVGQVSQRGGLEHQRYGRQFGKGIVAHEWGKFLTCLF